MSAAPNRDDFWVHHLLQGSEGIEYEGDFRYTLATWHYAISKSFARHGTVAISGRLLSLVTDGIEAHAQAAAARLGAPARFRGVTFESCRVIDERIGDTYELEPEPLANDPAHTNLRHRERPHHEWDGAALSRAVLTLYELFRYAGPGSVELRELEAMTATPA